MTDSPRRMFGVICVLVGIWIVTYWLYEPAEPRVTFGERPASLVELESVPLDGFPSGGGVRRPEVVVPVERVVPERERTEAVRTVTRVEAPKFREYTVRRGDVSWEVIAQRELGDRRLGHVISRSNPFVSPDKLIPGRTVLRIPLDPGNVSGRPVEVAVERAAEPERSSPEAGTAGAAKGTTYTIRSGDTLSGISQQVYGQSGRWRVIYDANRSVIRNPDVLPVGATITIPPKP